MPGKIRIQGATVIKRIDSPPSILPHEEAGGGTPKPKKLSEASAIIAAPNSILARIIIGAIALGNT